jgi:hypothetical protein
VDGVEKDDGSTCTGTVAGSGAGGADSGAGFGETWSSGCTGSSGSSGSSALSSVRVAYLLKPVLAVMAAMTRRTAAACRKGEREEELFPSPHPSTARPHSASSPPCVYVLQGARVAVMEMVAAAVVVVVLGARVC